ncbi:hypothetical protein [Undibacterium sp. RuRC25W]|uniref:hypothetical protein n=1 Tax=Undibacterium sp. RuRC25W TaxID=3413047 RepID=UPI003BF172A2
MNNLKLFLLCSLSTALLTGCGGSFEGTIGGAVTGLSGGTSVTLLNNGTDSLTVNANGNFTFATKVSAGGAYNVTVSTQPINETCSVTNGSGTISNLNSSNVTNIAVSCLANVSSSNYVYGNVTGLQSGQSVILQNNAKDNYTSTGGSFIFPTPLAVGAKYVVTVYTQPTKQTCTVSNGSGTVGNGVIAQITCQ